MINRVETSVWQIEDNYYSSPIQAALKQAMIKMGLEDVYRSPKGITSHIVEDAVETLKMADTGDHNIDTQAVNKVMDYWVNPVT